MPETRNLLNNQVLRMKGSLSPWTLNLPQGVHGDRIGIGTLDAEPADFTLNMAAGDSFRPYDGGAPVASFGGELLQEMWTLVFDEVNGKEWFVDSSSVFPVTTSFQGTGLPLSVSLIAQIIPFAYLGGDADLWTVEANGSITSKYTWTRPITVRARLACAVDTNGNNQGISIRADWLLTGTGSFVPIYDGANNASSRQVAADAMVSPEAIWTPVTGDNVRLEIYALDIEGGASSDVNGAITTVTVETN